MRIGNLDLKPVPPDHPMFHGGVSFVFRHDLPEDDEAVSGQAARFLARLRPDSAPDDED
jgi:hypothetical protein